MNWEEMYWELFLAHAELWRQYFAHEAMWQHIAAQVFEEQR